MHFQSIGGTLPGTPIVPGGAWPASLSPAFPFQIHDRDKHLLTVMFIVALCMKMIQPFWNARNTWTSKANNNLRTSMLQVGMNTWPVPLRLMLKLIRLRLMVVLRSMSGWLARNFKGLRKNKYIFHYAWQKRILGPIEFLDRWSLDLQIYKRGFTLKKTNLLTYLN